MQRLRSTVIVLRFSRLPFSTRDASTLRRKRRDVAVRRFLHAQLERERYFLHRVLWTSIVLRGLTDGFTFCTYIFYTVNSMPSVYTGLTKVFQRLTQKRFYISYMLHKIF